MQMSSDPSSRLVRPGRSSESPASAERDQEEALFKALLERLFGSRDKARLHERADMALRLLLWS